MSTPVSLNRMARGIALRDQRAGLGLLTIQKGEVPAGSGNDIGAPSPVSVHGSEAWRG
ncbi:MAG TPA: hypothetical protein VGG72_10455 [Bryobacteraceae bacterium]